MSSGLASMLAGQAPPQTAMSAQTPDVRRNPEHEWYVGLQRIRMTARDALMKADEQEPAVKAVLVALQGLCDKLLTGANPTASIASSTARMIDMINPAIAAQLDGMAYMLSQPPAGAGGPGAGPAQASPAIANPLAGAPAPPTPGPGPGAGQL